jgi:DNA modification methylase
VTTLVQADCVEAMRAMSADSIDAIVCDPPYGLEFMGKEWDRLEPARDSQRWAGTERKLIGDGSGKGGDFSERMGEMPTFRPKRNPRCHACGHYRFSGSPCACKNPTWDHRTNEHSDKMQAWHQAWAVEALRVLKPGAHLLAFGGTRTFHRLTCALEDAGFEIRDCLSYLYGSGFPKSKNIGNGFGTALKPAWEPIVLARKPISERNIAANVLRWGTGALNIDGCRVDYLGPEDAAAAAAEIRSRQTTRNFKGWGMKEQDLTAEEYASGPARHGRWPANVTLDAEAADALDQQSGQLTSGDRSGHRNEPKTQNTYGSFELQDERPSLGDAGGASRFFYTAKADRAERNAGLAGMDAKQRDESRNADQPNMNGGDGNAYNRGVKPIRNHHPTVKPVDLMCWLVRLATPPGGTVLDPFMGSGTTGMAALRQGFSFVGIEREPDYYEIAKRRIEEDAPLFNRPPTPIADALRSKAPPSAGTQRPMFEPYAEREDGA